MSFARYQSPGVSYSDYTGDSADREMTHRRCKQNISIYRGGSPETSINTERTCAVHLLRMLLQYIKISFHNISYMQESSHMPTSSAG